MLYLLFILAFVTPILCFNEQIDAPAAPHDWPAWLLKQKAYRDDVLAKHHYNDSIFNLPELQWTHTSFVAPQVHPFDRFFYDYDNHKYTIDRALKDFEDRYGGVDAMLIWPTYTNLGIDDRNQYDYFRAMPGGIKAWTEITDALHAKGIRVIWPYNPWDQGTRYEGKPDSQALTQLIAELHGDGINGDTMYSIPQSFMQESIKLGRPLAMEPEIGGEFSTLNWTTMGWGYWNYPYAAPVDLFKWLEPRRMTHICNRWSHNRTSDIQYAFFNGIGFVSWENVWGIWNAIVPRDGEALRRAATILRFFGARHFLTSKHWEPHTPVVHGYSIYSSKFPAPSPSEEVVWLLVNRNSLNYTSGPQLIIASPAPIRHHFYDCYAGKELNASKVELVTNNGTIRSGVSTLWSGSIPNSSQIAYITLSFPMEALGYGCVYATTTKPVAKTIEFLNTMKNMTAVPLSKFDNKWSHLQMHIVPIPTTSPPTATGVQGMVSIPAITGYRFQTNGTEVESDDYHGIDIQFPWEAHLMRSHDHVMDIPAFFMDKYPVTNEQYAKYLADSHYKPRDPYNFLKDWVNGTYRQGWAKKPVTYVSLNEARLYCNFYQKRLPHVWEWQYAAQGTTGNLYPWGNSREANRYPTPSSSRFLRGPDDVDAHSPAGDSPFGVADLVGNVWQYTDEFHDTHTRAVLLKGSSYYRPGPDDQWYFPAALEVNQHSKYLLFDDSYERAGTLGFRCVVDGSL